MTLRKVLLAAGWLSFSASAFAQQMQQVAMPTNVAAPYTGPDGAVPAQMVVDPYLNQPEYFTYYDGTAFPYPAPQELPPIPQSWTMGQFDPLPRLEVRPEVIFMQLNFKDTMPLANQRVVRPDNTVTNYPIGLDSTQQYITGARLTAEMHLNELLSIEGSFFYTDGPEQSNSLGAPDQLKFLTPANTGFLTSIPTTAPPTFPTVANVFRLDWDAEVNGADFTAYRHFIFMRGPVSDFAIGLGARYLQLTEFANSTFIDETDMLTGRLLSSTDNLMGGAQIASRIRIQGPFSWVRTVAEGKIGLMANAHETRSGVVDTTGTLVSAGQFDAVEFAALFEGSMAVEFFVTSNLTLFGGFQMLYVERVQRASKQYQTDLVNFTSNPAAKDNMFMFGPRVGFVVSY